MTYNPRLGCTCSSCDPAAERLTHEQQRRVQDATARLEIVRDLRELEVGHAGVKLTVADIAPPARLTP